MYSECIKVLTNQSLYYLFYNPPWYWGHTNWTNSDLPDKTHIFFQLLKQHHFFWATSAWNPERRGVFLMNNHIHKSVIILPNYCRFWASCLYSFLIFAFRSSLSFLHSLIDFFCYLPCFCSYNSFVIVLAVCLP